MSTTTIEYREVVNGKPGDLIDTITVPEHGQPEYATGKGRDLYESWETKAPGHAVDVLRDWSNGYVQTKATS